MIAIIRREDAAVLKAARLTRGPSDIIDLPTTAPLFLPCPHCRFLRDLARKECLSCGLIFSKWAAKKARTVPTLRPEVRGWADLLIGVVGPLAARPWSVLGLAALVWTLLPAGTHRSHHAPVAPSYASPWTEAAGLRLRVVYLLPKGFNDFHGNDLSPELWGTYPVFYTGETVDYRIELVNLRGAPLTNVRILAGDETINPAGGAGIPITSPETFTAGTLAFGDLTFFKGRLPMTGRAHLEQTHLRISATGPSGDEITADVPRAGIIDPPTE
jgi:hypothetical protein